MMASRTPTSRRKRFPCAIALVVVAAGLGAAVPAANAAVTIGSALSGPPETAAGCGPTSCTFAQRLLPGGEITAPFDGVIVRWRVRSAAASPFAATLRVIRGNGPASTGAGSSQTETVPAGAGIFVFETRVAIRAGDFIGVDCCPGGAPPFFRDGVPTGAAVDVWEPPLGATETRAPSGGVVVEMLLNADIEPDCDSDGFGDETQDPDIAPCSPAKADGTLTIDANKGKVEKGRKVTLSGQLDVTANEACEPGRAVQIQRRLKSEDVSKFATFKTVQTDATGNFSLRQRVRKTYFYRAVVEETEACAGEDSNSQKVRVQKKKAAQEA